jgi:hypothetical protein
LNNAHARCSPVVWRQQDGAFLQMMTPPLT